MNRRGIWNYKPTFLYPKTDYYYAKLPIVTKLVYALEARDFRVPGVRVKFHLNGMGFDKFKNVGVIECEASDIYLWFCNAQGYLPGYNYRLNDTSGLATCHIREHSCNFYGDGSGYEHWIYTGNDWNFHRKEFREWQYSSDLKKYPFRRAEPRLSDEAKDIFTASIQKFIAYIESFDVVESRDFKNSLAAFQTRR